MGATTIDAGLDNLARILTARHEFRLAGRPVFEMTLQQLHDELAVTSEHRDSETYTLLPRWAERVEDTIDAIEDEFARRDAQTRLGR